MIYRLNKIALLISILTSYFFLCESMNYERNVREMLSLPDNKKTFWDNLYNNQLPPIKILKKQIKIQNSRKEICLKIIFQSEKIFKINWYKVEKNDIQQYTNTTALKILIMENDSKYKISKMRSGYVSATILTIMLPSDHSGISYSDKRLDIGNSIEIFETILTGLDGSVQYLMKSSIYLNIIQIGQNKFFGQEYNLIPSSFGQEYNLIRTELDRRTSFNSLNQNSFNEFNNENFLNRVRNDEHEKRLEDNSNDQNNDLDNRLNDIENVDGPVWIIIPPRKLKIRRGEKFELHCIVYIPKEDLAFTEELTLLKATFNPLEQPLQRPSTGNLFSINNQQNSSLNNVQESVLNNSINNNVYPSTANFLNTISIHRDTPDITEDHGDAIVFGKRYSLKSRTRRASNFRNSSHQPLSNENITNLKYDKIIKAIIKKKKLDSIHNILLNYIKIKSLKNLNNNLLNNEKYLEKYLSGMNEHRKLDKRDIINTYSEENIDSIDINNDHNSEVYKDDTEAVIYHVGMSSLKNTDNLIGRYQCILDRLHDKMFSLITVELESS